MNEFLNKTLLFRKGFFLLLFGIEILRKLSKLELYLPQVIYHNSILMNCNKFKICFLRSTNSRLATPGVSNSHSFHNIFVHIFCESFGSKMDERQETFSDRGTNCRLQYSYGHPFGSFLRYRKH